MTKSISRYSFAIIISVLIILGLLSNKVFGASSDTKIKKIEVNPCINNIQQDSDNSKVYRVAVNNSVTSVNVNVEPNNAKSSVEVQGNTGLDVGTNRIDITITAEDGSSDSYIIYVRRLSKEIADTTITPNVQEEKEEFNKPDSLEIQPVDTTLEENDILNEVDNNIAIEENNVVEDENIVVEKLDSETAKWEDNVFSNSIKKRIFIVGILIVVIIIIIIAIIINKNKKYKSKH